MMREKEKLFLDLIDGFEWKFDLNQYPNYLFGFKNDDCLFEIFNIDGLNQQKIIANYRFDIEHDLKIVNFRFNYNKFWSVFESKYRMKYNDIQTFMSGMVEKHLKMRVIACVFGWWNHWKVEKHFKMK